MSLTKRNLSHEDFRNNGENDFDFDEYMYYKQQEAEYQMMCNEERVSYLRKLRHEQGKLKEAVESSANGDSRELGTSS